MLLFARLETTVPYPTDLHIDRSTKKLILNLVNSIRSVVPAAGPPAPTVLEPGRGNELDGAGPHGDRETAGRDEDQETPDMIRGKETVSLDCIRQVIIKTRKHSTELDGIFDSDTLLRYVRYVSDYQDIIDKIEQVRQELAGCRDSALDYAAGLAGLVEEHLQMTAPEEDEPGPGGMHDDCGGLKLEIV
jgi:hypothetical protein